jgi:hypothetical protein
LQATTVKYKLIKKIKDERFDEENLHQYALLLNIGTRDFQVGVVDSLDQRLLLLEDYMLPNVTSHEELLESLDALFDGHALLKAGFWKSIKISLKNQKFVQVPAALFSPESLEDYLRLNAHVNPETEQFLSNQSDASQAVTIFSIHKDLKEWLSGLYPQKEIVFTHQAAVMIEGVMDYAKKQKDNPLYVYVDRFRLHVLSIQQGKLIYYNQFTIKHFADYVKYIMLVMKSLNMNQKTSQVMLWGYIGKNSPHYHEFYKYINNVVFGHRPAFLQYGYMFDEVQEHHFLDLYSIQLIHS